MNRLAGTSRDIDDLQRRISALDSIVLDADGLLDADIVERTRQLHATATARLGHGTSHSVVALAGATGSGKSSLFNAISQTDFATVGVRRPTTSEALAVVFGDGAEDLLNWLDIKQRRRIPSVSGNLGGESGIDLEGLVLVDLPDHDSTEASNRAEVDRLVQVVDLFLWVVDPQKYADAALHEKYLQQFAGHGAVSIVVLNQADRLRADERKACMEDLTRLLIADGLTGVRVVAASALTGEGVDGLRRELSARVAERQALIRRIDADIDWIATDLAVSVGEGAPTKIPDRSRTLLIEAATEAAGARAVEHAVDASYRRRASLAVGWPPLRWIRKTKADPLSRLGLGRTVDRDGSTNARTSDAVETLTVRRTSITADPVASGRLGEALRDVTRDATSNLPEAPRASISARIDTAATTLPDALDVAAAQTDLSLEPPTWWKVVGTIQVMATLAMAAGLVWLLALFLLGWFRIPEPPLPTIRDIPLPTLLALGGGLIGFLLAVLGRRIASIGAKRRAHAARESLAGEVGQVIDDLVIKPVNIELAALGSLATRIHQLAR